MSMKAFTPLGDTAVLAAQDAEEIYPIGSRQVRILSDRNIHIRIGAGVSQNDYPIRAEQPEVIAGLGSDAELSIIKGAGETDGTVWITRVTMQ